MNRYYLHLRKTDQTIIEDPEGVELPDLDAARDEALAGARELMADAVRFGRDEATEAIIIADSTGRQLESVPLRAALPPSVGGGFEKSETGA